MHDLRVPEAAGLKLDDVDLMEGAATLLPIARKVHTIYLTDPMAQVLATRCHGGISVPADSDHLARKMRDTKCRWIDKCKGT
jgi:hypothetical protein